MLDPADLRAVVVNERRAAYYAGAVAALARALESHRADLVCRRGPWARTVRRLARETGAQSVAWSIRYDAAASERQRQTQATLEEAGLRVLAVHDAAAVGMEETSHGGRGYRAFAAFFAAWRGLDVAPVRTAVHFAPSGLAGEPLSTIPEFRAVEPSAAASPASVLERLARYLATPALAYTSARDVPGGEPTARLSAALSFGVVAARTVVALARARARDRFLLAEERLALALFERSLAQRDFFLQLAWFFEGAPDAPLQPRMRHFPFAREHPALPAWRAGETGVPFVDAGVRQLRATGWMHPRARLVAASFLCFDLGLDWRIGRAAWEEHLEEDDAALATGNWQWIAGVGADLAQFPRIYNPYAQARAYDPSGSYVRRWLPELRDASDAALLGRPADTRQLALPLYGAARYPAPVVDHAAAARAFLNRYAEFRRSGGANDLRP